MEESIKAKVRKEVEEEINSKMEAQFEATFQAHMASMLASLSQAINRLFASLCITFKYICCTWEMGIGGQSKTTYEWKACEERTSY